jgi:hypothetical protein
MCWPAFDRQTKKFPWGDVIPGATVKVRSDLSPNQNYHAGTAQRRVEDALKHHGATISKTAEFSVRVRIEDDLGHSPRYFR